MCVKTNTMYCNNGSVLRFLSSRRQQRPGFGASGAVRRVVAHRRTSPRRRRVLRSPCDVTLRLPLYAPCSASAAGPRAFPIRSPSGPAFHPRRTPWRRSENAIRVIFFLIFFSFVYFFPLFGTGRFGTSVNRCSHCSRTVDGVSPDRSIRSITDTSFLACKSNGKSRTKKQYPGNIIIAVHVRAH